MMGCGVAKLCAQPGARCGPRPRPRLSSRACLQPSSRPGWPTRWLRSMTWAENSFAGPPKDADMTVASTDYDFVRRLVHERSAIALADDKEYLIEARLDEVVRREGLGSLYNLVAQLRAGSVRLSDDVVEAMT